MAEFFVERQYWNHWPKVLLMCHKHGDGIERRRYVPDKGTCEVEGSTKLGFEPYYEHDLSCGHTVTSEWSEPPRFCPECGAKVVG